MYPAPLHAASAELPDALGCHEGPKSPDLLFLSRRTIVDGLLGRPVGTGGVSGVGKREDASLGLWDAIF